MIDIHNHIIFGVDDGAKSIEESIRMLKAAYDASIDTIIATPHFYEDKDNFEEISSRYQQLLNEAKKYDISLYLGSEIKISPALPELIGLRKGMNLNESQFMLIETPMNSLPIFLFDIIFKLQLKGCIPIIAHPERNRKLANNFELFMKLIDSGCLIQIDSASILGVYGWGIKSFAKNCIKMGHVHFIASDAHNVEGYSNWYLNAYKKVVKWVGKESANKMFNENARGLLF